MKNWPNKALPAAGALVLMCWAAPAVRADNSVARMAGAADKFLSTLNDTQRQKVLFSFDDREQRKRWSNLPVAMVKRAGLSMGELNQAQRDAAMGLVAAALSRRGFEKVQQIMDADELLKQNEHGSDMFGKALYFISILGKPSENDPWMLQFGGHHLALNITVAGARGVLTPSLIGAQPAMYTVAGKTIRPLGQESDKALALLQALDESQQKKAVIGSRMADLVLGPGQDGKTIQPEGLQASAMNDRQRAMLLDLISEWANIAQESAAAAHMAELKADLNQTWFAWSGPLTGEPGKNITAYYRVQGPHVVIEYAPQRLGGDPALHLHCMYRDPTNDYGAKFTAK